MHEWMCWLLKQEKVEKINWSLWICCSVPLYSLDPTDLNFISVPLQPSGFFLFFFFFLLSCLSHSFSDPVSPPTSSTVTCKRHKIPLKMHRFQLVGSSVRYPFVVFFFSLSLAKPPSRPRAIFILKFSHLSMFY